MVQCTAVSILWHDSHQGFSDIEMAKAICSSFKSGQDYERTWEHFTSSVVAEPSWSQPSWDAHGKSKGSQERV